MKRRINSVKVGLVSSLFLVMFPVLWCFGLVRYGQLALLMFLISFWVFRVVERKERADLIAQTKAEYLDGDSKHTA